MLYIIEDLKLVEVDIRYQGYCLISFYLGDMDPQSAGSIYRAENDIYIYIYIFVYFFYHSSHTSAAV